MIGQIVSHYKILEKLGEGGMGVVYKAQDTELDRIVALKFLPERLTSNDAERARFLQEAKAASALNHPNVCTIYGIDEFQGHKFIELEYIDGATLRHKIAGAPVKLPDAIAYAIQIGEALTEAHGKGIVHRDIKCENIMVNSKNQIKVMDFGLAKLKGSLKLTRTSSTVGTLAYMAPEQIQGGEVDARSDIFSFGVALFEMLTGRLPFRGEHEAAMMYSILNEEPESVLKERHDISAEFDRILRRALEKDPADRYQHVDDMVSEIRRIQKQSARVVRPGAEPESRVAESGAPDLSQTPPPARSRRMLWIALAGACGLIAAASVFVLRQPPPAVPPAVSSRKMLVVLPFENLGSPEQEYFADGITEEITSRLSGLSGLGVIARSSAMQYKKTAKPVKQIGEELGVAYILQGTVRWENSGGASRVRVNPQLISVGDGTQIWSQPSEAVMEGAFKLQSEIAGQVASALNVTLLRQEKQSLEAKLTENSEAYDSYLRGVEYLYRSTLERDYLIAEKLFQKAVELDPKFVAAYAKLAAIHSDIYWEFYDHTPERVEKSREAAERAIQLDPHSPEALEGMGWYYYHGLRDYEHARKEFDVALEAEPNNPELLLGLGSISRRQGNFEDAIEKFKRIAELDPRSPGLIDEVANTYVPLRKYAEAEEWYERVKRLAPDMAGPYYAEAWLHLLWDGDAAKAGKAIDEGEAQNVGPSDRNFSYFSLYVKKIGGKYDEAAAFLEASEIKVYDYQYWYVPKALLLAQLYGYLNETQKERSQYEAARLMLEGEVRQRPDDSRKHSALGIAYAGLGRKEDAIREGKHAVELLPVSLEAMVGPLRMQDLAQIYTMTGERALAIDQLERLLSMPSYVSVPLLRADPVWKPLRADPRFRALLAKGA
jgi:serine/threonine protein kinase/tetratricopeptide (TPR) repeat protein